MPAKKVLPGNDKVTAVVLGIMQDAGLPHAGCRCQRCKAAFQDPTLAQFATGLAIVDTRREPPSVWLIDASPDIKHQINLLARLLGPHPTVPDRLRQPDGLFLTHAHMGHTAGLPHLGPEGMNVQGLPLYASAALAKALQRTRLWQPLVDNLQLHYLEPGKPLALAQDLSITPIPVPHRDELDTGTFAFRLQGPVGSLLYLPDIDGWEQWKEADKVLAAADVALVDASFYSRDELGGRAPVAHPLVPGTLGFFAHFRGRLVLTHLNHTNPVLDEHSEARSLVQRAGVQVAFTGQLFAL